MLPHDFQWRLRCHLSNRLDGLFLNGVQVACLIDRVDGNWFALLTPPGRQLTDPVITRPCTSFESGQRGCEMWAARHEVRLRAEVAKAIANRPVHIGAGRWEKPKG